MSNLDAPPIWRRFRGIFLYALHPTPVGLSLTIGLLFAWFEPGLFFSIPLLFMGIRYAVEVFNKTAEGDLKPPGISYAVLVEDYGVTTKLFFLLFLILFLINSMAKSIGLLGAELTWYFFLVALPASYMAVMLTGSLLQGINPFALVKVMLAMGWSYWLLYGLLFVLSSAWMNLAELLLELPDPFVIITLFYMAIFSFNVIAFHMMGYMVYRRGDVFHSLPAAQEAESNTLALFEELLDKGKDEAARMELKRLIQETPADLSLYKRMHNIALVDQAAKDLRSNARGFIPRLIAAGQVNEAVEVYVDCQRFELKPIRLGATDTLALAKQLQRANHAKYAFSLLNGYHKRFPSNEHTFDAYLLGAKILSEDLTRDDLSAQMLRYLTKHFPQHERIEEVHRHLRVVESLASA